MPADLGHHWYHLSCQILTKLVYIKKVLQLSQDALDGATESIVTWLKIIKLRKYSKLVWLNKVKVTLPVINKYILSLLKYRQCIFNQYTMHIHNNKIFNKNVHQSKQTYAPIKQTLKKYYNKCLFPTPLLYNLYTIFSLGPCNFSFSLTKK